MAVGTGIGLNLSDLNKAFEKADQHIKYLTDKTKGLQKETINAFQQMAQKGVLPYVEALKQQKKYLEEIGKAKGRGAFFTQMQKEAKATVDEINKVISSLEKTTSFRNEASGKSAMSFAKSVLGKGGEVKSIDNMRKALRQLEDAQNRQNLGTERGRKNYEKIGETIRKVKAELDKATGANTRLRQESDKTKDAFKGLGNMISVAFAINAIRRFVTELIRVRGEFEMQHRSLQILLQDKEAADALWDKTVQLAVKSPFRVKQLVTYTKQLAAYRVEADKLYETNKMLADVSAGLGVDMNRLILAFGQVKAANFLRGTELRQFSEAGVNMLEELAKRFTMLEGRAVSVGDVFERVSKRMVSFKDVEAIFKTITSEGGVFYQMQEKQSETLRGMIMNLKDSIDLMFNKMGESNESILKNSVKLVVDFVNNWEKLKPVINGVTMALVTTLVGAGISKVIKGFNLAKEAFVALMTAIRTKGALASIGAGPWIALATILVGVVTTIAQAINSANRLQKELNKVYAEDTENLDKSIARYQDLVNRLRQTNRGSQERRDIIEKINNEYGKYLDFIVTEQTEIDKLVNSYDILVARMKEKAAASTYEKAFSIISDEYQKKMQKAQKDFEKILSGENFFMNEIPLEAYGLMQKGKNLFGGDTAASIMPTKDEINDIYAILEQRLEKVSEEEEKQLKKLKAQKELINSIIASYYGKEFYIRFAEGDKEIEIIETILEKKAKEREIEEQISRAYKETLKSRQARLEYEKLELEYSEKQREINAKKNTSPFETNKMLNKLREEFELNKIEIKFKFGQIGKEEYDRLRNSILKWATATTADVNNEIRRQLSNFMDESEWSNFLITPDRQAQGISGIIKEITNGYEAQVNVIKEQISLKSAGRKIDEKGLEFAEKQKRAYETVAKILGIELKTQNRISDSLREQINKLMPAKQKISLEDSYKSIKEIQDETNKAYKEQVETMTTLINQKREGIDIDDNALEVAREDLEMLREKMKLLGMKVDKPMSETTRNSINYFLPEEFKVSEADALKGIVEVNKAAASAFENAQKELDVLLKMQDQQVEGLEDEILLLESQLPYLQRKVELTGTEIKDRLSELQLIEINTQLSEEYQLDEINLYKSRSTILSEMQAKEKEITDAILSAKNMREDGLTIEDEYIKKLEEEYLMVKRIQDLIGSSSEEPIDRQRMYDINSRLDATHQIDVIDSQKSEVTLLQEANTEKEKAIAYEAQLLAMQNMGVTVTEEQLKLAKKEVEQWTLRWKLLGGTEDEKKRDSNIEERIKVVDQMNAKYKELNNTLSHGESLKGAFDAYKDAFATAYEREDVRTMTPAQFAKNVLNFPNEDAVIEWLDNLAKSVEDAEDKFKVQMAKGKFEMDIKVRKNKARDKQILDEIQETFDQYELSIELKKLNIPPDLAKNLFGVETKTLDQMRDEVVEKFADGSKDAQEILAKGMINAEDSQKLAAIIGEDQTEEARKTLAKIDEMEQKAQEERLKTYVEYARKAIGERAKIKLEELRKLKEIEETFEEKEGDSEETRQYKRNMAKDASAQVKKEADQELKRLDWQEFEKSDMFVNLFKDLEGASDSLLNHAINKLQMFKEEWKDMPLEDVRQIVEKMNELEDALINIQPIRQMKDAKKKVEDAIKAAQKDTSKYFESTEAKDKFGDGKSKGAFMQAIQEESVYQEQQKTDAQKQITYIETALRLLEGKATENDKLLKDEKDIQAYMKDGEQALRGQLTNQKGIITNADRILARNEDIVDANQDYNKGLNKVADYMDDAIGMANDLYEAFKSLSVALGADEDSPAMIFADMGMSIMSSIPQMFSLIATIHTATTAAKGLGTAMNMAMGIVGLIVMGVQLVVEAINAIAKANDNKIVAQLEEQAEIIERQRDIYEQLEERVEKAYNVSQLQQFNKELERSVELEIQALEASIALEKSRKNADEEQIKQYEEEIAEARKRLVESTQEMMEEMGGIFDLTDFASGFVDAWWDAMEEGKSGLDALSEHFDETMADMVKKQALYKGASKIMEQLQNAINAGLEKDYSIDQAEWDAIVETAKKANIDLDKFLNGYRAMFEELSLGSEGGLSGLQKGISGMSEQQAEILTAYWNSVRGYTASIDSKMDLILANMGGGAENNPMLEQLISQTSWLSKIHNILDGLTTSSSGVVGRRIKVTM